MPGALSGIRVIDFTRMQAGPFCAVLLRELGAHVIKVEFRESGDMVRTIPPMTGGGEGDLFMMVNRRKKSVTLDLETREAQKVALDLIAKSDILVENFTRGTMKKLGLDYKAARKVNPKLIYCSMSGFGREGPGADLLAFDMVARSMGGLMSVSGFPGSPPDGCVPPVADMGGGLYAMVTVLTALNHRNRTGEGQHINISMQDCIQAMSSVEAGSSYLSNGKAPGSIFKMSKAPGNPFKHSSLPGEHDSRIFGELLDCSEERIAN